MSPRSASVLTVISLAALTAAACSPKLAPSRDAPNPPVSGPPLRVDVVDPVDPNDTAPPPPIPAESVATEASAEAPPEPTPEPPAPEPTPVVHVEPDPEPEPEREAESEPEMVRASATHCHAEERTLYNCPFADGRVASVCVGDQIAYRFGPLGDPELDLTRNPDERGVRFNTVHRRGEGGQSHVRFQNGAYDYVVYSGRPGRRGLGSDESGVVVLRQNQEILRLECPVASAQTAIPVAMLRDSVQRERREGRYDIWW